MFWWLLHLMNNRADAAISPYFHPDFVVPEVRQLQCHGQTPLFTLLAILVDERSMTAGEQAGRQLLVRRVPTAPNIPAFSLVAALSLDAA
eukprot:1233895-Pleurochrysis_carterae.AAC.2